MPKTDPTTKSKNSKRSKPSKRQGASAHHKWKVTPLVDERTGNSCVGIDFPTRLHGRGFEVIDDDLVEQPAKVRIQLKKRGAAFKGSIARQIRFVRNLLKRASSTVPLILAMKPGFRDGGFILGKRMFGTAKGKYRWKPSAQHLGAGDIGDRRGDKNTWFQDVGAVALKSSPLSFGIMVALASCVPSYVAWRMKGAATLTPLLSETGSFNWEGQSGSGKTNIERAAAGLIGPPELIAKWDFSRRGLEELAESRNDLPMLMDDIETHVDDVITLKTALRYFTQIVPKGASKHLSNKAAQADLPALSWSTFGMTTSPPNFESIAKDIGWKMTEGERVRFICVPVPPVAKGGIFDRLTGIDAQRVQKGKDLTRQLERGVAHNYGLIFPLWIKYLLAADRSAKLVRLVEEFVRRVAGNSDGWHTRYARKFGVAYAVGRLAIEAGILAWPKSWPFKAVVRCYRRAIRAIRRDKIVASRTIKLVASLSADPKRCVQVRTRISGPIHFNNRTIGLRTKYRNKKVLAVRDEALRKLGGSPGVAKEIIKELQHQRLLVGGQGGRKTTQLPIEVYVAGKKIRKPRFWLINLRRLLGRGKMRSRKV